MAANRFELDASFPYVKNCVWRSRSCGRKISQGFKKVTLITAHHGLHDGGVFDAIGYAVLHVCKTLNACVLYGGLTHFATSSRYVRRVVCESLGTVLRVQL